MESEPVNSKILKGIALRLTSQEFMKNSICLTEEQYKEKRTALAARQLVHEIFFSFEQDKQTRTTNGICSTLTCRMKTCSKNRTQDSSESAMSLYHSLGYSYQKMNRRATTDVVNDILEDQRRNHLVSQKGALKRQSGTSVFHRKVV